MKIHSNDGEMILNNAHDLSAEYILIIMKSPYWCHKNARSIARVALTELSLACSVRAQTVLRFLQK